MLRQKISFYNFYLLMKTTKVKLLKLAFQMVLSFGKKSSLKNMSPQKLTFLLAMMANFARLALRHFTSAIFTLHKIFSVGRK